MSGSKSKNATKGRTKASRPSSKSGKRDTATATATATTSTLQDRARQATGWKRRPKFRASGDDRQIERRVPVPTQHNDNDQRKHTKQRAGALRRLGVAPEKLLGLPRITHILDHAEGGLPTVVAALRLSDDDDARKFLDRYDAVSDSDRKYLVVEEIAVAAEVSPKRLLEIAVSALVEDSRSSGAIIAATYHPRVIRKTAEAALHDDVYYDENGRLQGGGGHADRKLFLTGTGFLPQSSKGAGGVFVTVNNQNAQANVGVQPVGEGEPEQEGDRFNAAEDDLIKLHTEIDGNRLLEAPKVVESPSSVALGHMYRDMSTAVEQEEMDCIPNRKS